MSILERLDAALGQHQIVGYGSKAMQAIPKNERCDEPAAAARIPRRKIVATVREAQPSGLRYWQRRVAPTVWRIGVLLYYVAAD